MKEEYEEIESVIKGLPHFKGTNIFLRDTLIYQYRNFESFWQILDTDSLWATNARFSNDEAEQQFGKNVIASLHKEGIETENLGLDENYIICFCKEDDKLSQWRGYAPEGGVSMGFDFNIPRAFLVLNKEVDVGKGSWNQLKGIVQYAGLDEVKYLKPKDQQQSEEEYRKHCYNWLDLVNPESHDSELEVYSNEIQKKAPYIKHSGFEEENECRLVFHNNKGELNKCIRYRNAESNMLKYPYIIVKADLPNHEDEQSVVRICIQDDRKAEIIKEIKELLKKSESSVIVNECNLSGNTTRDLGEPFCRGCTLRRLESLYDNNPCRYSTGTMDYEYCVPNGANCIIVSQGKNQEKIFEDIHNYIAKLNIKNNKISVWCEGHLPLRKITVGPCANQNSVVEAIRYYCKHKYWLRDVEIAMSAIPFRKSL